MKKGQIPEVWKYRPDTVKPGDILGIYHAERSEEGNNKIKVVKEDWKVVQVLQFYALCVNKRGTRKSFLYHELEEKTNPGICGEQRRRQESSRESSRVLKRDQKI